MLGYLEAADQPTSSEPLIWTPSALQDRAKRLHSDISIFQEDMSRNSTKVPQGQLEAWRAYRNGWSGWYGDTAASTWLWSATASVLQDYESKLAAWRDWFRQNIGTPSGVGPSLVKGPELKVSVPELDKPELQFDWTPVWWGGGVLIALSGAYFWWLRK